MPRSVERHEEIFPLFSMRTVDALKRVVENANLNRHSEIGSDHLLRGLIEDEDVKAVFEKLGADQVRVIGFTESWLRARNKHKGKLRLSEDTIDALRLGVEEFRNDGAIEITPLHFLRGLALLSNGNALEIFGTLGLKPVQIYRVARNFVPGSARQSLSF